MMNKLYQYALPSEVLEVREEKGQINEVGINAVATWETQIEQIQSQTYYYNNVPVTAPFVLLNDSNGDPIWVIEAIFTFSDVRWRYARGGEVIKDFCGKRGQVDSDFTCRSANIFQLVPGLQQRGGKNVCFVNNACYNPALIKYSIGGRLMVIPNDKRGTYGDNSGAFDVKIEVIKFQP